MRPFEHRRGATETGHVQSSRRVTLGVVSASVFGAASLLPTSPAGASLDCQESTQQGIFLGGQRPTTAGDLGANAAIETNNSFNLCDTANHFTSGSMAWVMIDGSPAAVDNDGYVQIGIMHLQSQHAGGGQKRFFSEYDECNVGCTFERLVGLAPGGETHYTYKVVYDSSLQRLRTYIGTTSYQISPVDPINHWNGSNGVRFLGEVWDSGDDLIGTAADSTQYTDLQYYNLWNGQWEDNDDLDLVSQGDVSRYDAHQSDDDTFSIWTEEP